MKLSPKTFTEGGTQFDDIDVQFLSLKFQTSEGTRYDKQGNKIVPLLVVDMMPDGGDDIMTQYYSCGQLESWQPTPDGETLIDVHDKKGIAATTNLAIFLNSLFEAGVPDEKLDSGKISDLVGIKCHVVKTSRAKVKGATKESQVLTVSRLISVPWTETATTTKTTTVATTKETPAPAAVSANGTFTDADLAALAVQTLMALGGSATTIKLMQEVYKAAMAGAIGANTVDANGKPARTTAHQRLISKSFLESQSEIWKYDGTTVTLK